MSRIRVCLILAGVLVTVVTLVALAGPRSKPFEPTIWRDGLQYMDVEDRILDLLYLQASGTVDQRDINICRDRLRGELARRYPEAPAKCHVVVSTTYEYQVILEYPSMQFHRVRVH